MLSRTTYLPREPTREAAGRLGHFVGRARETYAQIALAAETESRARRHADPGLVHEAKSEPARIRLSFDRAEEIEGGLGTREANAPGRGEAVGDDVARGAQAREEIGEEGLALL